jgi:thiopeptide-type bacteriocin biosynthesis protein
MSDHLPHPGWVSAHLFYSDPLDPLLTNAIRPLVADLSTAGLARGYFFLRYWEGGPHLRLRVLPAGAGVRDRVHRTVAAHCTRYLRHHPSTTAVAAGEYTALAARLARWERLDTHTETLYPNNSVQFIGYRPEHDRYGTGACLDAVERHFMESSQIALALVTTETDRGTATARQTAAFCAAFLARLVCPPDRDPDPGPEARTGSHPDLDERYAGQRSRLLRLGRTMRDLAAGTPDAGSPGGLTAWRDSIVALRDTLTAGHGVVSAPEVVDLCVHLFCNRLGVSVPAESQLRYLVARTAADLATRGE